MDKESMIDADVFVAGKGLAGLAAGLFAARKGLKVVIAGGTSGCRYMSGLLDFLDICPGMTDDPVSDFSLLALDHPLKKIHTDEIRASIHSMMTFLSENGLKYENSNNKNSLVMTSAGSIRTTYAYPYSMKAGVDALKNGWPVLIVEFEGMKGFSAAQIAQGISDYCSAITVKIRFPVTVQGSELYIEASALSLDLPENRVRLAKALIPHIKDVKAVGLPPILGIYNTDRIIDDLGALLGIPVFEIPGMPPSVPGLRLEETMIKGLERLGVSFFSQNMISEIGYRDGFFETAIDQNLGIKYIRSKGLVLSTGRFLSRGLIAGRTRIYEPLLGLHVKQPHGRDSWHSRMYFTPNGHPFNRSGIETDEYMRPVGRNGRPVMENLYVTGAILSGQDWKREKCGAALSFASSARAVESLKHNIDASLLTSEKKYLEKTGEEHGNILFSKAV